MVLSCCLSFSYSQQGLPDTSFGNRGIVRTDFGALTNLGATGSQVLTQSNGTVYLIIQTNGPTQIIRLHADGTIDLSYGDKGYSKLAAVYSSDKGGVSAAMQSDGKIVVAGTSNDVENGNVFTLIRYNTDGTLDTSFSEDGRQTTHFIYDDNALCVAIQDDGKIVVAGTAYTNETGYDFAIARYNREGTLDTTFSEDGMQTTDFATPLNTYTNDIARSVTIQNDGKIVIAGSQEYLAPNLILARYHTDGTLDSTFSGDGKQNIDFVSGNGSHCVAIQDDGKIIVAGAAVNNVDGRDFALARLNANGTLDSTFSKDGKQTTYFATNAVAQSVAIQSNGKILLGGYRDSASVNYDFALARYNTDGTLDTTFSKDGTQTTDIEGNYSYANSLAIHTNGKIVMAGYTGTYPDYNFAVASYNTDGSLNKSFSGDGKLTGSARVPNIVYNSTAIQSDGKIVVAGEAYSGKNFDFAVARYNTDGSLDTTFSSDGRVTSDFASGDDYAKSVAIQKDGKIVVAGSSVYNFALARYNTNGTLDTAFSHDGKQTTDFGPGQHGAKSVAIQDDGKIILVGYTYYGYHHFAIARYNTDGTLDTTFSNDGKQISELGYEDSASAVAIQNDGKIVVAGTAYGNGYDFAIARYNRDGILDTTFSEDGIQTTDFGYYDDAAFSLAIQSDGKIVAAGSANNDFALTRYNSNGSLDSTFSEDGMQTIDFQGDDKANSMAIQSDGKIVAGGNSWGNYSNPKGNFALIRLNTNGVLDSTFALTGKQVTAVSKGIDGINSIAISEDKLYAAGSAAYFFNNESYYSVNIGEVGVVAKYLLGGNILPNVSITLPTKNAVYLAPAGIQINIAASDTDGYITKVELYSDSALLYTATAAPYSFIWKDVPAGNYTLTAKATDNGGLVTTAEPINIVIKAITQKPPTVSIIYPGNKKTFAGPTTIRLIAAAKDPDGTITKVAFYNDSTLLHTEIAEPYTYTWINVPAGNYTLTAVATDNTGLTTTSKVVSVSVEPNNAPNVSIINPADQERFTAPANIPLIASATDPDGTINKVEFYNGTALIATQYFTPYASTWNGVPAGIYTLTAKAIDNLGLSATSAPITITVGSINALIVKNKPSFVNNKPDLNDPLGMRLYPNPANSIVNIYTRGLQKNLPATISIISAAGIVLKTLYISNAATQLDVSTLKDGVYIIKILSEGKVMYKQFVKL